jgi:hypothetical protein
MPITVRWKFGEELAGVRAFPDGLAFQSPAAIPVGQIVELTLCGGSISVDAEIVECTSILDALGGFLIRARYHETSQEMRELLVGELRRHLCQDEEDSTA